MQRVLVDPSSGTVADHLGAMAAVVEVGAVLEHARVAVGFATAAATADWNRWRQGDAAALGRYPGGHAGI